MNLQTTQAQRKEFRRILGPLVRELELYISGIEFSSDHNGPIVRVYIDGPNGAGIEHCAKLTRESTPLLDVESPINGAYVLEISSPGMDRLLELPSDFQRFQGFNVSVRLPHRRSKIHGLLTQNDDGGFEVQTDIENRRFEYSEVSSVRLKVEPEDFDRLKNTPFIPPTSLQEE